MWSDLCKQSWILTFFPTNSKSQAGKVLTESFEDSGAPTVMHTDGAKEFTQGCWQEINKKNYNNNKIV